MATAHFGVSTPNFLMMETRISQYELIHEMVEEPVEAVNGQLAVSNRPGLGLTLKPEVLRDHLEDGES